MARPPSGEEHNLWPQDLHTRFLTYAHIQCGVQFLILMEIHITNSTGCFMGLMETISLLSVGSEVCFTYNVYLVCTVPRVLSLENGKIFSFNSDILNTEFFNGVRCVEVSQPRVGGDASELSSCLPHRSCCRVQIHGLEGLN